VSQTPITPQQVQLFMQQRQNGASQQLSAARAGFSVRTGYRIEKGTHQPKAGQLRSHRTRVDPLIAVWESELVPLLRNFPTLQPITLWEHLQDLYPIFRRLAKFFE
jgi:hypothetical protein